MAVMTAVKLVHLKVDRMVENLVLQLVGRTAVKSADQLVALMAEKKVVSMVLPKAVMKVD